MSTSAPALRPRRRSRAHRERAGRQQSSGRTHSESATRESRCCERWSDFGWPASTAERRQYTAARAPRACARSVEPSSTTTTCAAHKVWARTLSRHSWRKVPWLKQEMTMEMLGKSDDIVRGLYPQAILGGQGTPTGGGQSAGPPRPHTRRCRGRSPLTRPFATACPGPRIRLAASLTASATR